MSTTFPIAETDGPQPFSDSMAMFSRQTRRLRRYPELTVVVLAIPIIFLLLFVFVFGGTLGAGLNGGAGGGAIGATT